MPDTVTIPSTPSDRDNGRPDFWTIRAFAGACQANGIPMDKPIPRAAADLAGEAFTLQSAPSKSDVAFWGWSVARTREDAPAAWQRARDALTAREANRMAAA